LPDAPCNLEGLSVLVTRPAHQADGLCERIEQAHGRPVRYPTLEILGPTDKHEARARLAAAATADLLIFVSVNAVSYAFPLLPDQLPLSIGIAAVGSATAGALEEAGLPPTLVPARMDSEGLLALPEMQSVAGKRVIILRGNDGRELLAETLQARGAEVEQVEVYRRAVPGRTRGTDNLLRNWAQLVDVVTVTSGAIFDNLLALLGTDGAALVKQTPLVVNSQRLAEHAVDCGCEVVYVAASARDDDLLATLCEINQDVG
jgi:uroporphyrinogen-III synthase